MKNMEELKKWRREVFGRLRSKTPDAASSSSNSSSSSSNYPNPNPDDPVNNPTEEEAVGGWYQQLAMVRGVYEQEYTKLRSLKRSSREWNSTTPFLPPKQHFFQRDPQRFANCAQGVLLYYAIFFFFFLTRPIISI